MKITIFWHRRDLRFDDNAGLAAALQRDEPVLPSLSMTAPFWRSYPGTTPASPSSSTR
ncbi:deoxyribodipyrimidine photo-lyase [Hymenobacter sp. BRD67]|uniref:deoxyribodipyrimidine photo-lyase n=1 Tax=Hymenobacter sp. BRD67 TaxID=2675877 RepID=UPI0020B76341|nr:deoxyribodipyrimidine photo-lyase [Hymenobacter sp. BRD67]